MWFLLRMSLPIRELKGEEGRRELVGGREGVGGGERERRREGE